MSTAAERRGAFERADAIMALEGFTKTPEVARLQEAVIAGKLTFDQAVQAAIERSKRDDQAPGA
ncbi:MAG: antitoxin VbhA family protein [Burkholderiaceae bacterium]|jgi:hypothetical protein|nr:antitoxin VbhA family protein [Burkholderiaceae bacterium]